MKPFAPALGLLSVLWIFGGAYFLARMFCPAAVETATISVTDGDWTATAAGSFSFAHSGAEYTSTKDVANLFGKTGTYLRDNPQKMLLLTGVYGSGETNKTDYANLGLARAESLKATLVKRGANPDQISTAGVEKENPGFIEKRIYNQVNFKFTTVEVEDNVPKAVSGIDDDGNMQLFFEKDAYKVAADNAAMQDIIRYLESYLSTNPDAVIMVTGHTDNDGEPKDLMALAKKRAAKVRRAIRNYGGGKVFLSNQVKYEAMGPQQPIGSNETPEGRALNNRVTIAVK